MHTPTNTPIPCSLSSSPFTTPPTPLPPKTSLAEIQRKEESKVAPHSFLHNADSKWYRERRDRALSIGEIQKKEEEAAHMAKMVKEQFEIEAQIKAGADAAAKEEKAATARKMFGSGKKRTRRKKGGGQGGGQSGGQGGGQGSGQGGGQSGGQGISQGGGQGGAAGGNPKKSGGGGGRRKKKDFQKNKTEEQK